MPKAAIRTIDHDEIRRWVEQRGGRPARVKRTAADEHPGVLRINFPGYSGEQSLEELGWQDWFAAFEENSLAFLYQQGGESRFNKLVRRTDEEEEIESRDKMERASASRRWHSKTSRVTINDASPEELDALWGVGPQNARRIVSWRRNHGRIKTRDELLQIDGIDGATAHLIAEQASFE